MKVARPGLDEVPTAQLLHSIHKLGDAVDFALYHCSKWPITL
ncbi:hypothetical protein [Qipengyuania sp. 483]